MCCLPLRYSLFQNTCHSIFLWRKLNCEFTELVLVTQTAGTGFTCCFTLFLQTIQTQPTHPTESLHHAHDAASPAVPGIVAAGSENETRPSAQQTLRRTNAFWYRALHAGQIVGFGNNGGAGIAWHCVAQSTCCAMSTYYLSCPPLHASEWTSRLRKGSRWDRKFSSIFPNSCPEEMVQGTRWQKARHATEDGLCVVWESVWAPVCPFLKSTCPDFVGGGLVQAVLERSCGRWWTRSAAQPLALMFAKYARGCWAN